MSIYKNFSHDSDKVKGGVWHEIEGSRFKLAFAGEINPNYSKVRERVFRAAGRTNLSDEKLREIEVSIFVDAVLLGWENVTGPDDSPLEYNRAAAVEVLTDLPWLLETLQNLAANRSYYKPGDAEQDAKN
ncbi:hypothetical protein [Caudoviricetes sp.]|nr:hypothetical protein [Caudoviricetes sp.]